MMTEIAHFVTTCDDLVTTILVGVVTAESRSSAGFAACCDDCDDLFLYVYARTCVRARTRTRAILIYVVTVVTKGNNQKRINNLGRDDLAVLGRHKVVTGRHRGKLA